MEKCDMTANLDVNELLVHFNDDITPEMKNYVREVALRNSRYIFVTSGKHKKGHCTHCNSKFHVTDPVKQNAKGICPKCGSVCTYKHAWRGHKNLVDRAHFVWFSKSPIDPSVVTAQLFYTSLDFSEHYENINVTCLPIARYVFHKSGSNMLEHWWWNNTWNAKGTIGKPNTVSFSNTPCYFARESLKDAAENTQLQYSCWEQYKDHILLEYLALFYKYPSVEMLTKFGFKEVVMSKLIGTRTYSAIDWNARKPHLILKLSKKDFEIVQQSDFRVKWSSDLLDLRLYQIALKEKSKLTFEQLRVASNFFSLEHHVGTFNYLNKHTTIHKLFNYAKKQYYLHQEHYVRADQVLISWRDYIRDCHTLKVELTELVLFPRNLYKAHQETLKRVKHYEDELMKQKAMKRYSQVKKYEFTRGDFMLRAPKTTKEIIDEGSKLSHCVGSYADRHVKGQTCILFLRKVTDPETPFYTVELKNNKIVQVRGKKNASATEEIQDFIDEFTKQKLTYPSKSKERKVV